MRLLEGEIELIKITENRMKQFFRKQFQLIFASIYCGGIMLSLLLESSMRNTVSTQLAEKVAALHANSSSDLSLLHTKVNLLLDNAALVKNSKFDNHVGILLVATISLFGMCLMLLRSHPSFVILSKASEINKERTIKKLKKYDLILLFPMFGSVLLGVAGNFIYDLIK